MWLFLSLCVCLYIAFCCSLTFTIILIVLQVASISGICPSDCLPFWNLFMYCIACFAYWWQNILLLPCTGSQCTLYFMNSGTICIFAITFHTLIKGKWYTPSSARQRPSYGNCLEIKTEYYQNCSVLDCVTQCSQSAAHLYEQFLQVQQIGFVTLGPLCHAPVSYTHLTLPTNREV